MRQPAYLLDAKIVPAEYRVLYTSEEPPAGFYQKTVTSGNGELPGHILDVSGGSARIEIVLSAKAASVGGSVVVPGSDNPAPEATVVLIPQEKERRNDIYAYLKTTTDASGKFTVRNIPPGEYRAFALEWVDYDNSYMDPDFIRPIENQSVAVMLEESGHVDLKLILIRGDSQQNP